MGTIKNFIEKIKSAKYGKDVRQSIVDALEQTYEDAIANGHTDMEVVEARGSHNNLSDRLEADKTDEMTNRKKADENLQSQINSLASGSPKGNYQTVSALVAANPDTGVYVVIDDGHIYSWTKNGSNAIDLGVYQATEVANKAIDEYKLSDTLSKHIATKETLEEVELNLIRGTVISITGSTYANDYVQHAKALVDGRKSLVVSGRSQQNVAFPAIIFYNIEDEVIGYELSPGVATPFNEEEVISPTGTHYVVINGGVTTGIPSLKIRNQQSIRDYIDEKITNDNINVLNGKKIICNGDSITKGQGYYGDTKGDKSYINIIAERNNMTCINYAVSGATLQGGTNENVHHVCDDILNMDEDADYIIISAGYNDYLYNAVMGDFIEDYTTEITNKARIYGGAEIACRNLLTRYAGKKIGFVFTHKIKNAPYTKNTPWDGNGYTLTECFEAIKKVLKKYSIPYCDLYNESTLNTALDNYLQYTANNDGTHPTEEGYLKFYCDKVETFLKSL